MPDCMRPFSRIHHQNRDTNILHRKKNQMAGELQAKKKEEQEKAKREMYMQPQIQTFMPMSIIILTGCQPPSLLRPLLPSQHGPWPPLLCPCRHQLLVAHRPRKTRARQSPHGPTLCQSHPNNNNLCHGRIGETRSQIPHCATHSQGRKMGEAEVRSQGNVCGRLYCGSGAEASDLSCCNE